MHCINVLCRGFKLAAYLNSMGFFPADLGTEGLAVRDEIAEVRCSNIGVTDPLGEKLMIDVRGRNRAGEIVAFKAVKPSITDGVSLQDWRYCSKNLKKSVKGK